jgi:hypothetical protein
LKYLRSAGIKPILSNICYPVWELSLRKRKPAARKASKAVLINRDIALMSASWEDFRSWVLILKLVDANPFKNLSIK